jgi:hypothetical protein
MGNCVKRETGLEMEDTTDTLVDVEEIRKKIKVMKNCWKGRVEKQIKFQHESEQKGNIIQAINNSEILEEKELSFDGNVENHNTIELEVGHNLSTDQFNQKHSRSFNDQELFHQFQKDKKDDYDFHSSSKDDEEELISNKEDGKELDEEAEEEFMKINENGHEDGDNCEYEDNLSFAADQFENKICEKNESSVNEIIKDRQDDNKEEEVRYLTYSPRIEENKSIISEIDEYNM